MLMKGNSTYEIFVGGVSYSTKLHTVHRYFQEFGMVKSVALIRSADGVRKNIRISMANIKGYARILNCRNHELNGRSITCAPFMGGKALAALTSKQNKCKVILKGVPKDIGSQELKYLLENQIGQVEKLFSYKPEIKQELSSNRQFHTYSVKFVNREDADKLLRNGQLAIFKYRTCICVEKFKYSNSSKVKTIKAKE